MGVAKARRMQFTSETKLNLNHGTLSFAQERVCRGKPAPFGKVPALTGEGIAGGCGEDKVE